MQIKVLNVLPVTVPTWAKLHTTKTVDGREEKNMDDWWYMPVHAWAQVKWADGSQDEPVEDWYDGLFGYVADREDGGCEWGRMELADSWDASLAHYTTEKPEVMDSSDIN